MAPEASAAVVTAKKKGEGGLEKDLPSGCNCYMQILSIDGHDGFWGLKDVTAPMYTPEFKVIGEGQMWLESPGNFIPLPTPFLPLAPPDAGCHKFQFFVDQSPEGQIVTLNTKVICCQSGSTCTEDNAATVTYHSFQLVGENSPLQAVYVYRKLSCYVLIAGEENCDPRF